MPRQLILELPVRTARGRDDFFVSDANAMAVARLEDAEGWANGRLVLTGPRGAGKTHLVHVWAEASGARLLAPADLPMLQATAIRAPVALDDADRIGRAAEEPLFHLVNHLAASGFPLLMTAARPPRDWGVALPDLASRLMAADLARIDAPDDRLLQAVLVKLFSDRQLQVPPALIPWLAQRADRSFEGLRRLVAALDAAALVEQKRITRPLARRVLDALDREV